MCYRLLLYFFLGYITFLVRPLQTDFCMLLSRNKANSAYAHIAALLAEPIVENKITPLSGNFRLASCLYPVDENRSILPA